MAIESDTRFSGHDIDLIARLAKVSGVKVAHVQTFWPIKNADCTKANVRLLVASLMRHCLGPLARRDVVGVRASAAVR